MIVVAGSADESTADKKNPPKAFTPELLEESSSCLVIMCHANGEGSDPTLARHIENRNDERGCMYLLSADPHHQKPNCADIGMLGKCARWIARTLGVHVLVPEYPGTVLQAISTQCTSKT